MSAIEIQCLCGDVKLQLSGPPLAHVYCHCDDCRTAHSSPYVAVAVFPLDAVKTIRGEPTIWSLKRTPRAFCGRCGTRLFQEPPGFPVRGVNAALLPAGQFKPAWHQQCQYAEVPVSDALPHFKGYPAAFGGSDEKVDW